VTGFLSSGFLFKKIKIKNIKIKINSEKFDQPDPNQRPVLIVSQTEEKKNLKFRVQPACYLTRDLW
jgi:homogentisate 1,2-dioxygenase